MLHRTVFTLALAALALTGSALPAAPESRFEAAKARVQLSFEELFDSMGVSMTDNKDDPCPDLIVRCLKDGDVTQIVGDIGEQSFCRKGLTCKQCHSTKNTAQCNAKYLKDCAGSCEAQGSPI